MTDIALNRRALMIGGAMTAAFAGLAPALAHADDAAADYAANTLTIGLFSGDLSALAMNKAVHPAVQHFAKLEQAETSAVGSLLLGAGAAKPARPQKLADTLEKMKQMDPGTDFDRLYIKTEIDGHRQLLDTQKQWVKSGGSGEDKTIATILVPFIETHLTMLERARDRIAS